MVDSGSFTPVLMMALRTRLLRPINGEPPDIRALEDVTVRTQAARILETESFTESVFEQLSKYCQEIEKAVNRIASG